MKVVSRLFKCGTTALEETGDYLQVVFWEWFFGSGVFWEWCWGAMSWWWEWVCLSRDLRVRWFVMFKCDREKVFFPVVRGYVVVGVFE